MQFVINKVKQTTQTQLATMTQASWNEIHFELNSKIGKSVLSAIRERFKATYLSTRQLDDSRSKVIVKSAIHCAFEDCDKGLINGVDSAFAKDLFKTVIKPVMKALDKFNRPENKREAVPVKAGNPQDIVKFFVEADGADDVAFKYETPTRLGRITLMTTAEPADTSSNDGQSQLPVEVTTGQQSAVTDQQLLVQQHRLREQLVLKELAQKQEQRKPEQPVKQVGQVQPGLSKALSQPKQSLNPQPQLQEQSSPVLPTVQKADSEQLPVIEQKQSGRSLSESSSKSQPTAPQRSSSQTSKNNPVQQVPSSGYPPNHMQGAHPLQPSLSPIQLQPEYPPSNQGLMTQPMPLQSYPSMPVNQPQYHLQPGYPVYQQVLVQPYQYQVQPVVMNQVQYAQPLLPQQHYVVQQPVQVPVVQQPTILYVQNPNGYIQGAAYQNDGKPFNS